MHHEFFLDMRVMFILLSLQIYRRNIAAVIQCTRCFQASASPWSNCGRWLVADSNPICRSSSASFCHRFPPCCSACDWSVGARHTVTARSSVAGRWPSLAAATDEQRRFSRHLQTSRMKPNSIVTQSTLPTNTIPKRCWSHRSDIVDGQRSATSPTQSPTLSNCDWHFGRNH